VAVEVGGGGVGVLQNVVGSGGAQEGKGTCLVGLAATFKVMQLLRLEEQEKNKEDKTAVHYCSSRYVI
jgi:hypothetical protein